MSSQIDRHLVARPTEIKWHHKRSNRRRLHLYFTNLLLILIGIIMILPLLWMFSTALKTPAETFKFPPQWIPARFVWRNFVDALTLVPFHLFFRNTMLIIALVTLGAVFSNMVVGYSFARLRFRGKGLMFTVMLATMMIPYQVTMIPMYIAFTKIGWWDTALPLIVPNMFATPFFTFLARQYILTIPYELDEAARIDGCNTWQILLRVLGPICKPAMTMIVVFSFIWTWSDFLWPLIYLNTEARYTVALGLSVFRSRFGTQYNLLMAASLVATLPPLVIYYFAQDYIIGGIASFGLKG
ncbi:MAG: carbohydrate ABC transporter permease [Patescibacteria group bacterium]